MTCLCLSRSTISLAMNIPDELSIFLVMDPLLGSGLLEWGWYHSEDLNPDWVPIMNQSAKVDSRLSGEHRIACVMRYSAISIVTNY